MALTRRAALALAASPLLPAAPSTVLTIRGEKFHINGRPTYAGRPVEGLLLNSRMVQGIYDDLNPETRDRWRYPDTGTWDAERNTREFLAAMQEWRRHGLLGISINLQGGSPQGYSKDQPWHNSAFQEEGSLRPEYLKRLDLILDRADELGMAVIVGLFYFGQDQRLRDEAAVRRAVTESCRWLRRSGHRNLLIEVANECDNSKYDQAILKPARIPELIELARRESGRPAGTSFNGGSIPTGGVVVASDFLLLHGNGVKQPARITEMVSQARAVAGYRPMPILFNEDDHFDFTEPANNFRAAIDARASWGYFDPGESNYRDGYQCPPVNWGINTDRKRQFFAMVKELAGV